MQDIDPGQAHHYLLEFKSHFGSPQEAINYVNSAIRRFLVTLDMLPPGGEGKRLLELGAGPYFVTLLLLKYCRYELELANFYGDHFPPEGVQTVRSDRSGEEHAFRYRNFNCERDAFPYPDESFELVLCCEIIEHLTVDPTHMLVEIHRVLKPGGQLLVTTPNVLNLNHALRLLLGRGNIFHPYSGYGVYGRHQREYTQPELVDLLQGVGYDIVETRLDDIYTSPRWQMPLKRLRPEWRDNLFVLARKSGERRYYYPPQLYIAAQAIRRVVSSDVRIGWNDVGHLGAGWWEVEQRGEQSLRWTANSAKACLIRPASAQAIKAEVNPGPATLGSVVVKLEAGSDWIETTLQPDRWQTIALRLEASPDPQIELTLSVDRMRNFAALGLGSDTRDIGVMVRRIWLETL